MGWLPGSSSLVTVLALALAPAEAAAQSYPGLRCGAAIHEGEAEGFFLFPEGGIFCPLVADPKAEHSFLTLLRGNFPALTERDGDTEVGSIGLGDQFPILRVGSSRAGNSVQLGLAGAVFAQFDLRAASFDLINADYVLGLPLTIRRGDFSVRIRPYHQSSHLGDEFLLRDDPIERENLSFESLEVLLSQERGLLRFYGGGEYLFRREPDTLEELLVHGGIEVRLGLLRGPRMVAALDVKSTEEQRWKPATSLRGGVEIGIWRDHGHPPRILRFMGEYYSGPSPYGQFIQSQLRFLGLGVHFAR